MRVGRQQKLRCRECAWVSGRMHNILVTCLWQEIAAWAEEEGVSYEWLLTVVSPTLLVAAYALNYLGSLFRSVHQTTRIREGDGVEEEVLHGLRGAKARMQAKAPRGRADVVPRRQASTT